MMALDFSQATVLTVQKLYKNDKHARALFEWCARRSRDATSTSLDVISYRLEISRGDAVALARKLHDAGCGEFVVGRRGSKSRFVWAYSCIAIGQVASGEISTLEKPENPEPEDVEEAQEEIAALNLTIPQAKLVLANSLGIPVSSIEINIKA
jgi:hypothetical protein